MTTEPVLSRAELELLIKAAEMFGEEFALWLSKRPRIVRFPRLAHFFYVLGGGK